MTIVDRVKNDQEFFKNEKTVCTIKKKQNDIKITLSFIKGLGKIKSEENLDKLIELYRSQSNIEFKREIISSIGRQKNNEKILLFIKDNVYQCGIMDLVYQMYRTCLYKEKTNNAFNKLGKEIYNYFDNEVLKKMKYFIDYKQSKKKALPKQRQIIKPTLLIGDNVETLKTIQEKEIHLIFTSPPYYNAREYSNYRSYKEYLDKMYATLQECYRILEDGRFIIINVSPVITKRPGREFESIRYPIHFDFHNLLTQAGFYFIDEIQWIKPCFSVKNRNGGYQQTQKPLSYKPNCINESLLVYRKTAPFLLDENIAQYNKKELVDKDPDFDSSNCWYISPVANKNHPAVFPEELCRKVLTYYSFKTDIVLDPFAGSGTLGKVANEMNRIPVLCEIDKKYCNLIKKNLYQWSML